MITEDYVSFETAKLLKEKGFDSENVSEFGGYYIDYYHNGQRVGIATESMMLNKTLEDWEYLRPTLQMVMKWLREVHHLTVDIFHFRDWKVSIKTIPDDYFKADYSYSELKPSGTYEQACEAAIKYCLENLI